MSYPASLIKHGSGFQAIFGRSSPVKVLPIRTQVLHTLGFASTAKPFKVNVEPKPGLTEPAGEVKPQEPQQSAEPVDVAEERLRAAAVDDYEENPLVIRSLHKVYPAQDGQAPKVGGPGVHLH